VHTKKTVSVGVQVDLLWDETASLKTCV